MYKIYDIIVSGDRTTLYFDEIISLLNAYGIHYELVDKISKVLRIKIFYNHINLGNILSKSSSIRYIIEEKIYVEDLDNLDKKLSTVEWNDLSLKSFKVFFLKIGKKKKNIHFRKIMTNIVKDIYDKIGQKTRVDVHNPDVKIIIICIDSKTLIVGKIINEFRGDRFRFRDPKAKVFRHPSMLTVKDARVLYNLSLTKPCENSVLLDPFCGTGSILIEGGIERSYSIGVELKRNLIINALKNLREYNLHQYIDLINADSTLLPFRNCVFDCIATDPPYGKLASINKRENCDLLGKFISQSFNILKKNSRITIMYTDKYRNCILEELKKRDIILISEYSFTVHNELTRIIIVAEKK